MEGSECAVFNGTQGLLLQAPGQTRPSGRGVTSTCCCRSFTPALAVCPLPALAFMAELQGGVSCWPLVLDSPATPCDG